MYNTRLRKEDGLPKSEKAVAGREEYSGSCEIIQHGEGTESQTQKHHHESSFRYDFITLILRLFY